MSLADAVPPARPPAHDHRSLIDLDALRRDLAALPAGSDARGGQSPLVARLKVALKEGHEEAEKRLMADKNGHACAERLSTLTDDIVRALFTHVVERRYPSQNLSTGEQMAVVATGGYGRGLMAPGSDIDLLFLLPYKQTAWGESVAEAVLYALWDMGLKVGHATRSVEECLKQARADMTIRTALLDSRLILGNETLFAELERRFETEIVRDTAAEFIAAKLAERDDRLVRAGESRYLVEPNVKDGKGGLRDLHTLFWIAKYGYRIKDTRDLVRLGVFTQSEHTSFRRCEAFLWHVRCHLHFLTGRAEERLSFDHQREMARRLGYTEHPGLKDVERFMKHYFLVAKEVGNLTAVLCAGLEEREYKPAPMFSRMLTRLRPKRTKQALRSHSDFAIDKDRLSVADDEVFERDPVNLIRLFALADQHSLPLHPDALRLVTHNLKRIDTKMRDDNEAYALLRAVITSHNAPEISLRRLNEAGVLGRFLPDFGKIVAMMQFSLYHHYTVDEHLLRAVGIVQQIEQGSNESPFVLAHDLMRSLQPHNRDVLYMATFLHDIAKGRPEDHSLAGARVARKLAPRFGFNAAETETIAWLIENHLVMSTIAQSRDLSDRKTIETFAGTVQNLERLKLLYILTCADIAAVGPGVLNGWKASLLKTLYYETEPAVTGGFSEVHRAERVARAQAEFAEAVPKVLPSLTGKALSDYMARHYPPYWLKIDLDTKIEHARFLTEAETAGQSYATQVDMLSEGGVTLLTVLAPDHPRLLSIIAGACAASGANIVSAQVYTTSDGLALDTIAINRAFERDDDEERRGKRIAEVIEKSLRGEMRLKDAVTAAQKKPGSRERRKPFAVESQVSVNNSWSNRYTVVEVEGLDRTGLLHELTQVISRLNLNIGSAHITTYGEKAVDVFYVTDLMGAKIISPQRQAAIRRALMAVFEEAEG